MRFEILLDTLCTKIEVSFIIALKKNRAATHPCLNKLRFFMFTLNIIVITTYICLQLHGNMINNVYTYICLCARYM